jgi:hypothetical protein
LPVSISRTFDLLGKWKWRARKALNSGVRSEVSVSAALEESYQEGLKRAARHLEESGHPDLARQVLALMQQDRATG